MDTVYVPTKADMLHQHRVSVLERTIATTKNDWLRDLCVRKLRELRKQRRES